MDQLTPVTDDAFSGYHPAVNLLFFASVIGLTMFLTHPMGLAISAIFACTYAIYLNGKKALRLGLLFMLPLLIFAAVMNPLFNHRGATILAYLPNGNPVTLESIAFGITSSVTLITVIAWFSCLNVVLTSDKFIYLFGRIIPALSLILSMALRFVPRFRAQFRLISNAQRCIGRDVSNGSIFQRAKYGLKILSILVTWVLENSVETADSMKARGYGLPGRTAFSIFTFTRKDACAYAYISTCSAIIIAGAVTEVYRFRFFPTIRVHWYGFWTALVLAAYLALAALPIILNLKEELTWKRIESKI